MQGKTTVRVVIAGGRGEKVLGGGEGPEEDARTGVDVVGGNRLGIVEDLISSRGRDRIVADLISIGVRGDLLVVAVVSAARTGVMMTINIVMVSVIVISQVEMRGRCDRHPGEEEEDDEDRHRERQKETRSSSICHHVRRRKRVLIDKHGDFRERPVGKPSKQPTSMGIVFLCGEVRRERKVLRAYRAQAGARRHPLPEVHLPRLAAQAPAQAPRHLKVRSFPSTEDASLRSLGVTMRTRRLRELCPWLFVHSVIDVFTTKCGS